VTGYVLVMSNYAQYISLTSLRIIRGRTLFFPNPDDHTGFSLFVSHNYKPGSLSVGLKELQLVSLHGHSQPSLTSHCRRHVIVSRQTRRTVLSAWLLTRSLCLCHRLTCQRRIMAYQIARVGFNVPLNTL